MKLPSWITSNVSEATEIQIPNSGVLLVILGVNGQSGAIASLLSPGIIDGFQEKPEAFHNWLSEAIGGVESGLPFRLIGNEQEFSAISALLSQFGFSSGKHVPIQSTSPTLIHFFPKDGKIRMPKFESNQASTEKSESVAIRSRKTKVLVVDDSDTIRKLLSRILNEDSEIECVATVDLPSKVEEAVLKFGPDVITLDIHMPEMDGVTLLKKLLLKYSIPTVMISALSKEDGTYVLDALEAGAVDYIQALNGGDQNPCSNYLRKNKSSQVCSCKAKFPKSEAGVGQANHSK